MTSLAGGGFSCDEVEDWDEGEGESDPESESDEDPESRTVITTPPRGGALMGGALMGGAAESVDT